MKADFIASDQVRPTSPMPLTTLVCAYVYATRLKISWCMALTPPSCRSWATRSGRRVSPTMQCRACSPSTTSSHPRCREGGWGMGVERVIGRELDASASVYVSRACWVLSQAVCLIWLPMAVTLLTGVRQAILPQRLNKPQGRFVGKPVQIHARI